MSNNKCRSILDGATVWPNTPAGEFASMPCFGGIENAETMRRECGSDGLWKDTDYTKCYTIGSYQKPQSSDMRCPSEQERFGETTINWPLTSANYTAKIPCPGGIANGYISRTCGSNGTWSGQSINNCPCIDDPTNPKWTKTPNNTALSLPCSHLFGTAYTGVATRKCINSKWEPAPVENQCPLRG